MFDVKLVVQVRLLPTPEQAAALEATLRAANDAATWVSALAHHQRVFRNYHLRKHAYGQIKDNYGLAAQAAQHVIKKVTDAYATLHANLRNGSLGRPGSARRERALATPIVFRPGAAQPFDDRCLSWQMGARTVSIWTTCGRMKSVAFSASADQLTTLAAYRKGESDLLYRDGMWFLIATCDVPDRPVATPDGFLGVDLGIANLATTSGGVRHSGKGLNAVRHRHRELRRRLQAKQTKSAKRLLKKRRRKEARFAADTNHRISKSIVAEAARTGRRPPGHPRAGTYGSASPSGSRCIHGASTSSAGSSPTRRPVPVSLWYTWTRPTPR
ncbi:transposase, partial [Streptosporangium sp. NPDC002607]